MRHLSDLGSVDDPDLLLGLDAPDDAAVYRVGPDLAIVQTVDFFTPIVDDPYAWGAIAAANALSDVYAMGARPVTGLNLVGWPMHLDIELLARVLKGGADKCREAGAAIVGGHTVDDSEPKYGLAITGLVDPNQIVRVSTAKPDMDLILTKPIGSGIVATGLKNDRVSEEVLVAATEVMLALNKGASDAIKQVGIGPGGIGAATDVTGFGLMGHLRNMLASSGVGAEIWASEVPLLPGVLELVAADMIPGGTSRNFDFYSQFVEAEGIDADLLICLFDAQTSGGLLIAAATSVTEQLIQELQANGTHAAARIGRTNAEPRVITVRETAP